MLTSIHDRCRPCPEDASTVSWPYARDAPALLSWAPLESQGYHKHSVIADMTLISLRGIRSPPCDLLIMLGDPNHSRLLGVLTLNLQCSGLPSRLVGFGEESALGTAAGASFLPPAHLDVGMRPCSCGVLWSAPPSSHRCPSTNLSCSRWPLVSHSSLSSIR